MDGVLCIDTLDNNLNFDQLLNKKKDVEDVLCLYLNNI